jgi:hypothetical protein
MLAVGLKEVERRDSLTMLARKEGQQGRPWDRSTKVRVHHHRVPRAQYPALKPHLLLVPIEGKPPVT